MTKKKFIIICLFFIGCKSNVSESDLKFINGYWKINYIKQKNEVFSPRGDAKILDYYVLDDRNGFRKKVQPTFKNNFLITDDQNNFSIIVVNNNYFIQFETKWHKWKEKIIKLNEKELILEHFGKKYFYQRFIIKSSI